MCIRDRHHQHGSGRQDHGAFEGVDPLGVQQAGEHEQAQGHHDADGAYTARMRVVAGQMHWLDDTVSDGVSGGWQTFESPAVQDGAQPDIELEISVGAGSLRVIEESR